MPTVLDAINRGLRESLRADEHVYLIGEDILDPYGGAFKATRGLSTEFPDRVRTTPISEAGIVGVATGMALRGMRSVVEIMFGDFTALVVDQLINHAAKFRWMYADQVRVPLVVRAPMGGRRGYGPTHSQTLERLFLGAPGLRVLAPTAVGDVAGLLRTAVLEDDDPVLFVENKLLYLAETRDEEVIGDMQRQAVTPTAGYAPSYRLVFRDAGPPRVTLCAYGHMAEIARQALERLAYEHEVLAELVVPTQLSPPALDSVMASVRETRRLVVAEEGVAVNGWGAEVVARISEELGGRLRCAGRVGAPMIPIPSSVSMETQMLPSVDELIKVTCQVAEA